MQHFWRQVGRATAEGLGELLLADVLLGQSKVSQAAVTVRIDEDVLRFEVAVDDVEAVDVLDGEDDLRNEESGLMLFEDLPLVQMVG